MVNLDPTNFFKRWTEVKTWGGEVQGSLWRLHKNQFKCLTLVFLSNALFLTKVSFQYQIEQLEARVIKGEVQLLLEKWYRHRNQIYALMTEMVSWTRACSILCVLISKVVWKHQVLCMLCTDFSADMPIVTFPLKLPWLSDGLCIDYSHIVLTFAIWPGDRIRRPEHSTVEHGSCDRVYSISAGRTLH